MCLHFSPLSFPIDFSPFSFDLQRVRSERVTRRDEWDHQTSHNHGRRKNGRERESDPVSDKKAIRFFQRQNDTLSFFLSFAAAVLWAVLFCFDLSLFSLFRLFPFLFLSLSFFPPSSRLSFFLFLSLRGTEQRNTRRSACVCTAASNLAWLAVRWFMSAFFLFQLLIFHLFFPSFLLGLDRPWLFGWLERKAAFLSFSSSRILVVKKSLKSYRGCKKQLTSFVFSLCATLISKLSNRQLSASIINMSLKAAADVTRKEKPSRRAKRGGPRDKIYFFPACSVQITFPFFFSLSFL